MADTEHVKKTVEKKDEKTEPDKKKPGGDAKEPELVRESFITFCFSRNKSSLMYFFLSRICFVLFRIVMLVSTVLTECRYFPCCLT